MNIIKNLRDNKLTLIAAYKYIMELAAAMHLSLEGPLSVLCENARVNQTQVYERKNLLAGLELATPGRPAARASDTDDSQDRNLQLKVLRYRLEYPEAVVFQRGAFGKIS